MQEVPPNAKLPRCTNNTRTVYGCNSPYGVLAWVDRRGCVTYVNFSTIGKATRICKRLFNVTRIPHQVLYEVIEREEKAKKRIRKSRSIYMHGYYSAKLRKPRMEKRMQKNQKEKKHGTD